MNKGSYAEKSKLLLQETLDVLRNKPINSTFYERLELLENELIRYRALPQPLRQGYAHAYFLENISCPVQKHDILLGRIVEIVPDKDQEKYFQEVLEKHWKERIYFTVDTGHCTFDWENLIKSGLNGYIEKCDKELQRRLQEGDNAERIIYLQGMQLVYRAYQRYIERYAIEAQKAGLVQAATACHHIAYYPPSNFYEAMQLYLFVTHIYSMCSVRGTATLSCGRMDDILAPFYERDIAEGRLTREEAGYIIDDFNCKSAMTLGRGEHQMSGEYGTGWIRNPMYDNPTYVILGGYSNHSRRNPLTELFLERIHPRLENPVYVFRRTKETDRGIWTKVCDKLRQNASLLVYNDETVIPAMRNAGIDAEDAVNYTMHGCNWPDIQGMNVNISVGNPIPARLMEVLFDQKKGKPKQNFSTMEEIYKAFEENWRQYIREKYKEERAKREREAETSCQTLYVKDCFMRGPLEKAIGSDYAVKYRIMQNLILNVGTAADILAALEQVVFGENPVSMDTLAEALSVNFKGYEDLHRRCKKAPKFGQDDERSDAHAVRIIKCMTDIVSEEAVNPKTGLRDLITTCVTATDMLHLRDGSRMGATPDGRLAGQPLSENLSPSVGSGCVATELLNSVSKLPLNRICSGALNVRMSENIRSGDKGLMYLAALLETYFNNGGMQIQLSVADTKTLQEAQMYPEKYSDLMVRITGYSAVFVDMCREAQNEIIRRDEMI